MNRLVLTVVSLAAAIALGVVIGRVWQSGDDAIADAGTGEREILYWKAPMDPNYRRDEPGKSPMGMDLVPVTHAELNAGTITVDAGPDFSVFERDEVTLTGVASHSENSPLRYEWTQVTSCQVANARPRRTR